MPEAESKATDVLSHARIEGLLMHAREEIASLRRRNELLAAKVETMDMMAMLFNTSPSRQSICVGEDVVFHIETALADLRKSRPARG